MKSRHNQLGLSLVEVMIALVLGLILTLGVAQIFNGSQQSFRLAQASARTQESARVAVEILNREIRNADYWGCVKRGRVQSTVSTGTGYDVGVHGFTNVAAVQVAVAGAGGTAVANSHTLTIRGSNSDGIQFVDDAANTAALFKVSSVEGISKGDFLLLSDCGDGVLFQVSNEPNAANLQIEHLTGASLVPGNGTAITCPAGAPESASCFPKSFTSGEVYRPYIHHYEVRDVGGRRGLYLVDGGTEYELVDDIQDMRIQVGEASAVGDTEISAWKDASTAGIDFDKVLALRVSLLVRSPENNVVSSPQSLCYPAWATNCSPTNWTAPDRRKYEIFTTTTSIRNRLIPDITES